MGTGVVGEMVLAEKGSFTKGNTWGNGFTSELPVHQVTLTYNFEIGKYEVTFDEYDAFCDATGRSKPDDWGWGRVNRPVILVSWWDAIAYCNWVSNEEGLPNAYDINGNLLDANGNVTTDITEVVGYRLPTDAEWEYAARGGEHGSPYIYSGSNLLSEVAWYYDNSGGKTHEVGLKLPNTLGIFDMTGNVWEWCSDWFEFYSSTAQTNPYNSTADSTIGFLRVLRGGGCYDCTRLSVICYRSDDSPTYTYRNIEFLIAITAP